MGRYATTVVAIAEPQIPAKTLTMARIAPEDPADHKSETRDAYDRLAAVWAESTDEGPFNGLLERPAMRELIPQPLAGLVDEPDA